MNFLIFKISGDYAHFKKYYTTTSPLTFDFPPRTVISGIIGAIIGLSKNPGDPNYYLKHFRNNEGLIAIKINRPIKKAIIPINYLKTSSHKGFRGFEGRKQIRVETVKDPDYTIFFSHSDPQLYRSVKEYLAAGKTFYTPYLGSSEYLAKVDFIEEVKNVEPFTGKESKELNSVLNCRFIDLESIDFDEQREYMKITVPNTMAEDRVVIDYTEVLYERKARTIRCIPQFYYRIGDDNIIPL